MKLPAEMEREIAHANKYSQFVEMRDYLVENHRDYSNETYGYLDDLLNSNFKHHFDPVDCNNIEKFYLIAGDRRVRIDAIGLCNDAKHANVSMLEYISTVYPAATDMESVVYGVSEREATLAASVGISSRKPVPSAEPRPSRGSAGGMGITMNPYTLPIEQLRDKIEELQYALSQLSRNDERLARIEHSIMSLQEVLGNRLLGAAPAAEMYSLSVQLGTAQYRQLTRTLPAHHTYSLSSVEKTGRGQYSITITADMEHSADLDAYIHEIQSVEAPAASRAAVNPAQYDEVMHALCVNYSQASGEPCNGFNQGALVTLARNIANLINQRNLQWDSPGIDLASIDLFIRRGVRPYPSEAGEQAFTALRNQIYAISSGNEAEGNENMDEAMVLAHDYVRYAAILEYNARLAARGKTLPAELSAEITHLESLFAKSGYSGNMSGLLQLASSEYSSLGMDIEAEIAAETDRIAVAGVDNAGF